MNFLRTAATKNNSIMQSVKPKANLALFSRYQALSPKMRMRSSTASTDASKFSAETSKVPKAAFNWYDPRTYPRTVVVLTVVSLVGLNAYRMLDVQGHHFTTEAKNDAFQPTHQKRPVELARTVSNNGPHVMNKERLHSVRHEGLGVDPQEWEKQKKAKDETSYAEQAKSNQ